MGSTDQSGTAGTRPFLLSGTASSPAPGCSGCSAGRVTVVSAPAGSGKTLLLRSWIGEAGLAERAAWVAVQGEERDPQRFWLSVLGALRDTAAGSALVRPLTAAPDLDGWAVVERLLEDLGGLEDRLWPVIDDAHELRPAEALRQLELLVLRAPAALRFVLATRHDLRLGLHRLRLEGELTEIRAADLGFTRDEARALFEAAGIPLSDPALRLLYERTEGWAAGLRLAALSLAGHPDPGRFAAEFSGSERTVAEYLLAEVLDRQSKRQLGLQTISLDTIVGTAGQRHDFDRHFRPTSNRVRERWEQLALAQRRGAAIPPIEVYRVGGQHFVSDGHHRVSIAAATGQLTIDAYVIEILTTKPPNRPTRPLAA